MLRLIGLVVVVLFVLSLAHGERSGGTFNRLNSQTENLVDQLTGALADGVRNLGDTVFGPADPATGNRDLRDVARSIDGAVRSADSASRRAMAQMVLRACPSLGLVCQPAPNGAYDPNGEAPQRPAR